MTSRTTVEAIIREFKATQEWNEPDPNIDQLIADFVQRTGFSLPEHMCLFYRHCGSARIHGRYTLLPIKEWQSVSLLRMDEPNHCPESWYVFCELEDSDYVGIDLDSSHPYTPIIYCDHEDCGTAAVIARSFVEFLARMTSSRESDEPYWCSKEFEAYDLLEYDGDLPDDENFWRALGPEEGPDKCAIKDCGRLSVAFSTMCRRHHYESVLKRKCPFDDEDG